MSQNYPSCTLSWLKPILFVCALFFFSHSLGCISCGRKEIPQQTTRWITGLDRIVSKKLISKEDREGCITLAWLPQNLVSENWAYLMDLFQTRKPNISLCRRYLWSTSRCLTELLIILANQRWILPYGLKSRVHHFITDTIANLPPSLLFSLPRLSSVCLLLFKLPISPSPATTPFKHLFKIYTIHWFCYQIRTCLSHQTFVIFHLKCKPHFVSETFIEQV